MVSNANNKGLEKLQSYKVTKTQDGRAGWIYYKENENELRFPWEYIIDGIGVSAPSLDDWDIYCTKHKAEWAKGRREEILQKVAQSLLEQLGDGGYEFKADWINIHVTHYHSFFSRLISYFLH